tara:strand:+ start:1861 stop:3768 length:1908 start_codon:yes stop_codon:yes gene_type:complete
MAYFKDTRFKGLAPAIAPRLLDQGVGQKAENIDFTAGVLTPIKQDSDAFTLSTATRNSIFLYEKPTSFLAWSGSKTYTLGNIVTSGGSNYKYINASNTSGNAVTNATYWLNLGTTSDQWMQWDDYNIDIHPGPIPDDTLRRIYWSGEDYPRMSNYNIAIRSVAGPFPEAVNGSYRLGVPQPAAAPTLVKTGTADATQTPNDVAYVFTYVSDLGEEGAPSPVSAVTQLTDAENVNVTLVYGVADNLFSGYNISASGGGKVRIYRSNTGSTNTTFQFAGEVAFGVFLFADTNTAVSLGEVLPSNDWIPPPNDDTALYPNGPLQGLLPVANGTFCGFTGKRFCMSESFLPHAWPIQYRKTLDSTIIAIASTRGGVVALTDGKPVLISGSSPAALTTSSIDLAQSCINKDSVVKLADTVVYAGPDGLCAVDGAQGRVVTENQITAEQWNDPAGDFRPSKIKAFRHENTYVAFWEDGGNYGGWVFDPRGGVSSLSTLSVTAEVRGGYLDPRDNQLYLIVGNKVKKYRGATTFATATFKSKQFVSTTPVSMGWISVDADEYPITVKVYADGTLISNYTLSFSADVYTQATTTPSNIADASLREPIMRLPPVVAQEWEVELSSAFTINEFCLSQSMAEIQET